MSLGFAILNNVSLVKNHFYEPGYIHLSDAIRIGRVNRAFHQKYFSDPNFRVWIIHNFLFNRQFKVLRAISFDNLEGSNSYEKHLSLIAKVQSALRSVSKQVPLARLDALANRIDNYASEYSRIVKLFVRVLPTEGKSILEAWEISDELTRLLKYREIFQRTYPHSAAHAWLIARLARLHPEAVVETIRLTNTGNFDPIIKALCPIMPDAALTLYEREYNQNSHFAGPLGDFPDAQVALRIAEARKSVGSRNQCYLVIAKGLAKRDLELCRSTLHRITDYRIKNAALFECIQEFLEISQIDHALEFADLLTEHKEDAYEKIANFMIERYNELPNILLDGIQSQNIIWNLKKKFAIRMAPINIDKALEVIESINDRRYRTYGYFECLKFIPKSKLESIASEVVIDVLGFDTILFINKIAKREPRIAMKVFMRMNEQFRIDFLWQFFRSVVTKDVAIAAELMEMFQNEELKNLAKFFIDLWHTYPDIDKLALFLNSEKVNENTRPAVIDLIAQLDIERAIRLLNVSDLHLLPELIKIQAKNNPLLALGTVQVLGKDQVSKLQSIIVYEGVFTNIPQALEVYNQISGEDLKVQMLSVICEMMPKANDYELIMSTVRTFENGI